ncbi:hypothetical protein HPP92_007279 [Vanilla planifolia]|uniref:Uncharacterized protein n=1 Tax=Vanilla planifolia TaxID=51239 RepID=A0A835RDT5_VANPL|nr:hypothetical protein HPP92_007279 [Vanilla planifolia]
MALEIWPGGGDGAWSYPGHFYGMLSTLNYRAFKGNRMRLLRLPYVCNIELPPVTPCAASKVKNG